MSSVFSKLKRLDKDTISFTLSPSKYQYANTLRRAIQSEVPCLGFRADIKEDGSTTDVKIMKNSTPMSNEMLADRVGLLPIAMPKDVVNEWNKNSVLFRLQVKNETDQVKKDLSLSTGSYKPENYSTLQQQRANERNIRKYKLKAEINNTLYQNK